MVRGFVVAALVVAAGCHRDPNVAYAHLLERAASWSASARFANELARRGETPRGYLRDVLEKGAEALASIADQIEKQDDVPQARRTADAAACRRLAALFTAADTGAPFNDGSMHEAEAALRASAGRARSGPPLETKR